MGAGAVTSGMAATASLEMDGLDGIWGGGSWDPTQIFGGEGPVYVPPSICQPFPVGRAAKNGLLRGAWPE
jgi:hypothetical protein